MFGKTRGGTESQEGIRGGDQGDSTGDPQLRGPIEHDRTTENEVVEWGCQQTPRTISRLEVR